jgi:hypothetical protein
MTSISQDTSAMGVVAANSAAIGAIAASASAMSIVAENYSSMDVVANSYTAMGVVATSAVAMGVIVANSTAMDIVARSNNAMSAIASSKTALSAIWAVDTALAAIRNSDLAVDALVASTYTTYISNNPSKLTDAMVTTKSILIKSQNTNDSDNNDTNYLQDKCSNGAVVGKYTYTTSTSYTVQMLAFSNIKHYDKTSNDYTWQAYIIDCD